ncbi:hypothetical protein IAU60_000131 [Kwoniella sp. DSM 27419]
MLLANYNSDSDSGSDDEASKPAVTPQITVASSSSKPAAKPVGKAKKPVKITLDLPKGAGEGREPNRVEDAGMSGDADVDRGAKAQIAGGKGGSSLLGMLPPPKRKILSKQTATKAGSSSINRLGSGDAKSSETTTSLAIASSSVPKPLLASTRAAAALAVNEADDDEEDRASLLPPSLARKRKEKEKEDEGQDTLDLFGLASTPKSAPTISAPTSLRPPSISSAPLAPDYAPPEPTASDPYPGYYQLPNGEWRAYDPEYYHSFFPSQGEDGDDGRVGKHWDDYESGQHSDVLEINAIKGVEEARKEEERRQLAKRPKIAGEEFEYKPMGQVKGLASQRHQLTSLLSTAYSQREELEDRIAANKKSMRMAGTKYGF